MACTRIAVARLGLAAPLQRPLQRQLQRQLLVRALHASSARAIIPPGPQKVLGSVNDAQPLVAYSPTHGSYMWTFERLLALGLVPLIVAPFVGNSASPVLDALLGSAFVLHSHLSFDGCIVDYIPHRRFPGIHAALQWLLRGCTGVMFYFVYSLGTDDVGVTEAVKQLWHA